MAAIDPIEFGKTLRPTTVDLVNKLNETITAVNALNPESVTQLTSKVTAAEKSITTLTQTQSTHTEDIDKIKVTLYTPLASTDTDPSRY